MDDKLILLIIGYSNLTVNHIRAYEIPREYVVSYTKLLEPTAVGLKSDGVKLLVYKVYECEVYGYSNKNELLLHSNKVEVVSPFEDLIMGDNSKRMNQLDLLTVTGISKEMQNFLNLWTGFDMYNISYFKSDLETLRNKRLRKKIKPTFKCDKALLSSSVLNCGTAGALLHSVSKELVGILELELEGDQGYKREVMEATNNKLIVALVSKMVDGNMTTTFGAIPLSLSSELFDSITDRMQMAKLKRAGLFSGLFS